MEYPESETPPSDSYAGIRSSRRIPMAIEVESSENPKAVWRSLNVSEGGMFLTGAPVLDPGTPLHLRWSMDDATGRYEILTTAQVVWSNDPEKPKSDARLPAGMGIEFRGLDPDSRRLMRSSLYGADTPGFSAASDEEELLAPGTVVGSYRVLDLLGTGGMACVYLAEHLTLGRRVALKMMLQRFAGDRDAVRRFFDEGRLVNRVRHDNVVEVTDFVTEGPNKYYVMELLEGETLADARSRSGGMPATQVAHIGQQIASALQAVHDVGVVHRDLKPANIFLTARYGTEQFVKLLDFGVAKLAGEASEGLMATQPGLIVGTPGYVAPEYGEGHEPDARSDIYALGAILYELAAGQMVFRPGIDGKTWSDLMVKHCLVDPTPPSKVRPGKVPRELNDLILWCLAKDPDERPQTMAQVADFLAAIEAGKKPSVRRPRTGRSPRRRWWLGGAIAAGVVIAGSIGLGLWLGSGADDNGALPGEQAAAAVAPAAPQPAPEVAKNDRPEAEAAVRRPARSVKKKKRRPKRANRSTMDPFAD